MHTFEMPREYSPRATTYVFPIRHVDAPRLDYIKCTLNRMLENDDGERKWTARGNYKACH